MEKLFKETRMTTYISSEAFFYINFKKDIWKGKVEKKEEQKKFRIDKKNYENFQHLFV